MKQSVRARWLLSAAFLAAAGAAAIAAETTPAWIFTPPDTARAPAPARAGPYTVPGSAKSFTQAQVDDLKNPPDWFPDQHPAPPSPVVRGKDGGGPRPQACGSCHLMSGMGHPESSSLAGQPLGYLRRQMADFRSGARANRILYDGKVQVDPANAMADVAKSWSEAELEDTLKFYAALKAREWVKVVESKTAPKSYVARGYMRLWEPGSETEPLGLRIIEGPQDQEQQLLRNPNSGTVAYVPEGSVERGAALVAKGSPLPCASCHGADLKGLGEMPGIAGRSPTYTLRQFYFFREDSRAGPMAAMMKQQVSAYSDAELIDISAYLATLKP